MDTIIEWFKFHSFLVYVLDGFELVDLNHWHMFFDVAAHAFCACISSKVNVFYSLSVNLGEHMFRLQDQVAVIIQF